jgi:hypothetical protein
MGLNVNLRAFKVSKIHIHVIIQKLTRIVVPPAELEGVLLTHPRVVDAGVIGVFSEAEATEYPR